MAVVVGVIAAGRKGEEQRSVKAATVRDRVGVGQLDNAVEIVEGELEACDSAHGVVEVPSGGERGGEADRAFQVTSLGVERTERGIAQIGGGYSQGPRPPGPQFGASLGKCVPPVTRSGTHKPSRPCYALV